MGLVLSAESVSAQQTLSPSGSFSTGLVLLPRETYSAIPKVPAAKGSTPSAFDLSPWMPVAGDQNPQASCVAWAVGYAARGYYAHAFEHRPLEDAHIPSPAYIYNSLLEKFKRPPNCESGTSIESALDLLKGGVPSAQDAPYNKQSCLPPTQYQRSRAVDFRIAKYETIYESNGGKRDSIMEQLALHKRPVIIGMRLRNSFFALRDAFTKYGRRYYNPPADEPCTDSNGRVSHCLHALTVVGYDKINRAFKVLNSWGANWNEQGYVWIDFDAFERDVEEAYVITALLSHDEPLPNPPEPSPPLQFDFVSCGYVELAQTDEGRKVRGVVGTTSDLQEVQRRARLNKVPIDDLAVRPFPQCEVLSVLADGLRAKDAPAIRVRRQSGAADALVAGSPFVIDVQKRGSMGFVHVTYINADGEAIHLVNNSSWPSNKSTFTFGDGTREGGRFTVDGPPFGPETVIAIATRSPLFTQRRPEKESAREFLTALSDAIQARPRSGMPARTVAAGYDTVTTIERTR